MLLGDDADAAADDDDAVALALAAVAPFDPFAPCPRSPCCKSLL